MQNIKEYIAYDPEKGIFTRLVTWRTHKSGDVMGSKQKGYTYISYKRKVYLAHRLAWFFIHGVFPNKFIDHVNQIKTDNRLCNLREASPLQNQYNRTHPQKRNLSNYIGVTKVVSGYTGSIKYVAQIRIRGVKTTLGRYNTVEEASAAYLSAKQTHHKI